MQMLNQTSDLSVKVTVRDEIQQVATITAPITIHVRDSNLKLDMTTLCILECSLIFYVLESLP